MSVANSTTIATAVTDLLKKGGGRVVLLSGPWGSGKTYLWRKLVAYKFPSAHVLSLFGLESVGALKAAIASANIQQIKNGEATDEDLKALGGAAAKMVADLVLRSTVFSRHLDPISLVTTDQVLCLDDLERISPNVALKDVLGVANYLAEVKNWRILIIANPNELAAHSEKSLEVFNQYRERVLDREFVLAPDLSGILDSLINGLSSEVRDAVIATKPILSDVISRATVNNLRTIRRMVEETSEVVRVVGSSADISSRVRFLAGVRCELDAGRVHPLDFYAFDPVLTELGKRLGSEEEISQRRRTFLETYFGSATADYEYSAAIFALLTDGFIDGARLLQELNPPEAPLSEGEKTVESLRSGRYRYLSDADCLTFQNRVRETILKETSLPVADLVCAWVYHCAMRRMIGLNPEEPFGLLLQSNIRDRLKAGDRTYNDTIRILYSESHADVEFLMTGYDELIAEIEATENSKEIIGFIEKLDVGGFVRGIVRMPNKLRTCLTEPVLSQLFSSYKKDRYFHLTAASMLADELGKYDENIIRDIAALRERFAAQVDRFLSSTDAGASDRWRFAGILRITTRWTMQAKGGRTD